MPLCTFVMLEVHPAIANLVSVCKPDNNDGPTLYTARPLTGNAARAGQRAQPAWNVSSPRMDAVQEWRVV